VKGRLLLNVVVLEGSAVLELLASEDESLLVWGDSFLVLDLGLDGLDAVGLLDFKGDSLASEGLHEDLHSSSEAHHEMNGRLLLDVIVLEGSVVLELLASEDESLLVCRDSFLLIDLGLYGFDGVGEFNLYGSSLSG